MVVWAVFSIAQLPPLDGPPPPREGGGILDVLSVIAIALFAFAALRLVQFFRYRGETILLAMAAAVVLLAEALIAILVSRNWHFSWWEWHLLLLAAFLTIALAARNEYRRRGSLTGAFGGLYLEATLARVDRWYAAAVASVAAAQASWWRDGRRARRAPTRGRHRRGADAPLADGARGRPARRQLPPVPAGRRHGTHPPSRHVLPRRDDRRRARRHRDVRGPRRVHAVQRAPRATRGRGDAERVLGGGRARRRSRRRHDRALRRRRRADRLQRRGQPARPRAAGRACRDGDPDGHARHRRCAIPAGRSSGSGSTPGPPWSVSSGPPHAGASPPSATP